MEIVKHTNVAENASLEKNCSSLFPMVRSLFGSVDVFVGRKLFNNPAHLNCHQSKMFIFEVADQIPDMQVIKEFNLAAFKQGKQIVCVSDTLFDEPIMLSNIKIFSCPPLLSLLSISRPKSTQDVKPQKKLYNCFINRVDPVRQSWFYMLWLHNLLDKGYVSFLMYQSSIQIDLVKAFTKNHYAGQMHTVPKFETAFHALKDVIPYRNFTDTPNLDNLIQTSKYSLVLDTYATADDRIEKFVSEKVLRTLEIPTVEAFFVQKGCLKKLKELKFEFNDALLSHDDLPWTLRQQNLMQMIINDDVSVKNSYLIEKSRHNQNILAQWRKQLCYPKFYELYVEQLITW